MISRSIQHIEDLSNYDAESLAKLLRLLPNEQVTSSSWLRDQKFLLATFPPRLRRSKSILPRIATALKPIHKKAHLCDSHKALNPVLIRRLFLQVTAECAIRIARLSQNKNLPKDVAAHVERMQRLNSLWSHPDLYRAMVDAKPSDKRYQRVESECEACILAHLGGNNQVLMDMRASIKGRRKRGHMPGKLIYLVDAWIDWAKQGREIRAASDSLSSKLLDCRKEIQRQRRRKQGRHPSITSLDEEIRNLDDEMGEFHTDESLSARDSIPSKEERPDVDIANEDDEVNEQDLEESIIDYHTNRMSTAALFSSKASMVSDIHPAFRAESTYISQAEIPNSMGPQGTFPPTPPASRPSSLASQSRTSTNPSLMRNSQIGATRPQSSSMPHDGARTQWKSTTQTPETRASQIGRRISVKSARSEWETEYWNSDSENERIKPISIEPDKVNQRQVGRDYEEAYRQLMSERKGTQQRAERSRIV